MQNCSLQRRMLLVLIALLFLPVVSAFAVNNTFPVTVLDDQNLPVPGAEVIVYDNSVYWGTKSTGYTDSTGKVNVVVGDLYQTADSLTNPSHNIGIVAIPANASNSTALAFGRTTLRFYNVFGVDALAPMSTIQLNPGCKLTVSPKVIEDNVELSAIRTSLKINLPDVPQWVKTFELMPGSIGETNPSWQIYWPKNTPFVSEFWEDSALNDPTKAGYYQRKSDYFQIADETEKAFSLVHTRLQKGRVNITSNTDTTYFELRWNKSADFNYYEGSTYLTGSGTIYLPKNTYYFVVKPQLTGTTTPVASEPLPPPSSTVPLPSVIDPSTLKAPVVLFANVAVGDEPAAMSFNAASGKSVSGVVALEGVTSPTYAPQVFLAAQQKVGDLWIEVDSTWLTDAAGSYCFGHLFDPTKEYRIITKSSSNPSAEGVVDYYSNPAKCFANHNGVSMNVTVDTTYNISLPQVAGVEFVLSYPVNPGYIKDALFAYLPTESENWSNRIYDYVFVDQNRRFVPFAETDRPIVVRADYVYGNESLGEVVSKVSTPVVPEAGKTTVVQLAFDPTKVVKVQSDVKMADTGLRYLATNVRAWASPVINFNGKEFNAAEIFGLGYQYGVFNKTFTPIDQSIFEFSVEKGTSYQIGAVEDLGQLPVRPLMGFVPYHELVQVSETQTSPFVRDILLDEGNSFLGHVAVNGVDQASTTLFIKLDPVYSDYSQGEMYPRQGVVTTDDKGKFLVSGLTPGRYMAELNLEFMPATYTVYNSQTMPLIVREIFVDSNATAHPAEGIAPTVLAFNLNPSLIGWLNGVVFDEAGKPVAGAQIQICRNNPNNDATSPYYNPGKPVFYCLTNASGSIVTPNPDNSLVPLESGSYDIFVKGLNYPNGPLYEFSGYDSRPFATVKISAGGMVTPVKISLKRKFSVSGVLSEDGIPVANIWGQLYRGDGTYVTPFMSRQDGTFMFDGGLLPGQYLMPINIEDVKGRRFYLESLNIASSDMTNLTLNLDSTKLETVNLLAKDSNGQILTDVGGQIMLFADTALGENSPRWYATWAAADLTGKITVSLPTPPSANSAYGFVGNPRWFETFETAADGSVKSVTKMFNPPGVVMLDVPATADKTVIWQAPSKVTVNALLPAGANEKKYIGVLMTEEFFMAGKQDDKVGSEPYHPPMTMPGHGDNARNTFYAPCEGGKFVFDNILPDKNYVFVAYEAFAELYPDMIRWTYEMPAPAVFRHFSETFAVATEPVEIHETFSGLAPVTIQCSQKPELLDIPDAIVGFFTTDKLNTIGKSAWQILEFPFMQTDDSMVPDVLDLPVGYAFRISVNPGMPGFLAKNLENLVVPPEGRTVDILLNELPKLNGTVVQGEMPVNGYLLLIPEGVDPTAPNFNPIKVSVNNGSYTAFLKSGFYDCYAVPFTGATMLASITMATTTTTAPAIELKPAVVVSGKVAVATAGTELPLVGSSIMVMRKRAADSTMTDGAKLIPYPAVNGSHVISCGPSGEFSFLAEPGVNYYVQAIVPAGFNPGGLKFVPVTTQAVNLPIILGEGGKIAGNVNVPARIEARPVGTSAIGDQFSTGSVFYAEALFPEMINGVERYAFTIVGLDANMLYNITIVPMDGFSSVEKRLNVDPKNTAPLSIDLQQGNTIRGQLVDASGNSLMVANVPVSLEMILPGMSLSASFEPVVAPSYRMRKNVVVNPSLDYGLNSVISYERQEFTDQYGRFEFKGIPSFLTAFIRTREGISFNGVSYARVRTENFPPNFVNNLMTINLKTRLGGKIIGRLIDKDGKPVTYGMIETYMGVEPVEVNVDSTGAFSIEGLAPGANYIVNLIDIPGIAPWFRSGVLVEPGKATDLGSIVVEKAVMTFGMASGTQAIKKRSFNYGMPEDVELAVLAVDGARPVTDDDLLTGRYRHSVTGYGEIYLDPFSEYNEYGFSMFTRPGKTNLGVLLSKDSANGVSTLVTWGWRPGLNIPTEEQLDYGSYEITSGTPPLMFPQEFGAIEGTIKHSTDAVATFSPETAVIALYPVDVVNSVPVVRPVPFPTAVTNPVNGKWYINDVPVGTYRVKVVTQKYGTFFDTDVTVVNNISTGQAIRHDIILTNDVVKVSGKVVLDNSAKTPVAAAKVSLVLKKLATTTAADGTFSFFLPKGDFLIPQVEVSKPGIQTIRFFEIPGIGTTTPVIASAGAIIAADVSLGEFIASGSVGSVEVTVISGRDNKISVGAEVALVYKEVDRNVWIVGEAKATDENGKARFASVPVGREVSFRARAHYHVPTIATKTVDIGGAAVLTITMPAADPKVFYTGVVEPQAENGKYEVKAMFDFDQVVLKSDVGLKINELTRTPTKYPDEIFERITSMYYQGIETVVENGSLIASVSYRSKDIGAFRLLSNAVFRKEYAVDPLSADGFTGRQTDASGTMLPTGITVPPGFLSPEIDSFSLEVATPSTEMQSAKIELDDPTLQVVPQFAGPTFSFNFGQGQSNFGGGTASGTQGLFEITIAYTDGTVVEPRWYDVANNRWSKVGIIPDSIHKDYPQPGYMTFKVDHLTDFAVLKNVVGGSAGIRWDFNGDGRATLADLAIGLAYYLAPDPDSISLSDLTTNANAFYSKVNSNTPALIKPSAIADDLNNDQRFSLNDIALFLAWYLAADPTATADIENAARGFYGNLKGGLANTPGTSVSR